jgi:hypothetical protein
VQARFVLIFHLWLHGKQVTILGQFLHNIEHLVEIAQPLCSPNPTHTSLPESDSVLQNHTLIASIVVQAASPLQRRQSPSRVTEMTMPTDTCLGLFFFNP